MITIHIVGDYSNNHHYERIVEVPFDPDVDIDDRWWDTVWPETGDGQTGRKVVGIHTCTVVAADPPHENLVGTEYELGG